MSQQHPFFARCAVACLIALLGLFVVISLSIETTAPIVRAADDDRLAAITFTGSIDLAPDNGSFVEAPSTNLPGVQNGSATWGDCNNDMASDILLTGQLSSTLKTAQVYQQQAGGSFSLTAVFSGVVNGAAVWGDYDNDGWLDIALTGEGASGPISQIYHNERQPHCTFSVVAANLVGLRNSVAAWGDYNADGQLDLVLAGHDGSQPVTKLYRNNHGSFNDSGLILPGIQNGAAAWGDYDNDGLADLLVTGLAVDGKPLTRLYHNNGFGALNEIQSGLPALSDSAAAWGDYDNDGYLDLLLEGTTEALMQIAEIYHNAQGTFVKNATADNLTGGLSWSGAAWGDYDTDGYLDALISSDSFARAYRNEITGSFAAGIQVGLSVLNGTAGWGHFDGDRVLDVLVTGQSVQGLITKIYRYSILAENLKPDPPTNLTAALVGSRVVLRWSPPITDDHTSLAGLSYNLRVGTQPGGIDVIAPMAITSTGHRLLPASGNVYQSRVFTLSNPTLGQKYYWSVQAIDTSFTGSSFAAEGSFQLSRIFLPVTLKDFVNYYTAEWETNPNNTYLQSNGPLKSGQIYRGLHDDERDFYSVYLADTGALSNTLSVDMTSLNGGTQIQLFYQIVDVPHRVGYDVTPPYHIGYVGSPGWYYIYVHTSPSFVVSDTYTLTVTFP